MALLAFPCSEQGKVTAVHPPCAVCLSCKRFLLCFTDVLRWIRTAHREELRLCGLSRSKVPRCSLSPFQLRPQQKWELHLCLVVNLW